MPPHTKLPIDGRKAVAVRPRGGEARCARRHARSLDGDTPSLDDTMILSRRRMVSCRRLTVRALDGVDASGGTWGQGSSS